MPIDQSVTTLHNKTVPGALNTITDLPTTALADGAVTEPKLAAGAVATAKVANDAVTNAKLANMAQATVKGRASAVGTGDPQDLTVEQVRTVLSLRRPMTGPETFWIREGGDGSGLGAVKGATAFGSYQDAIHYVDNNIFTNGYDVTFAQDDTATLPDVYGASGSNAVISIAKRLVGGGRRIFQGAPILDGVWLNAADGPCIDIDGDFGEVIFTNFFRLVSNTGTGINYRGIGRVNNGGYLRFVDCNEPNGVFIKMNNDNTYFSNGTAGTLDFADDASVAIFNDSGTFHDNGTIKLTGTRTFGTLYDGNFFSQGYIGGGASGAGGFVGTFSGKRATLRDRAVLRAQTSIPGTLRGDAQPGSVFSNGGQTENVVRGSAMFSNGTSVAVVFASAGVPNQFDTNYKVTISATENNSFWVADADRATTGFTLRAASTSTATVRWELAWL